MKTLFKTALPLMIALSLGACNGNKKPAESDSTAVKVDSSVTTVIDSNKIKADSIQKDTASSTADSTKKM